MTSEYFPFNIAPSSRSFSAGKYPQTVFEAQNGAKSVIRYGNKAVNATMQLGFTNISDNHVSQIIDNYIETTKDWSTVIFNERHGLQGITSGILSTQVETGLGGDTATKWKYSEPPSVTSVQPGINNVTCSFVACLDGD